jgi:hypothetical protein
LLRGRFGSGLLGECFFVRIFFIGHVNILVFLAVISFNRVLDTVSINDALLPFGICKYTRK